MLKNSKEGQSGEGKVRDLVEEFNGSQIVQRFVSKEFEFSFKCDRKLMKSDSLNLGDKRGKSRSGV